MFERLQSLPLLLGLGVHDLMNIVEKVKFAFDKPVFDAVYYTVLDALNAQNKPAAPAKEAPSFYRTMTAEQYRAQSAPEKKPAFPSDRTPVGSFTARPKASDNSDLLTVRDVAEKPGESFLGAVRQGDRNFTYHITPPPVKPEPVKPARALQSLLRKSVPLQMKVPKLQRAPMSLLTQPYMKLRTATAW